MLNVLLEKKCNLNSTSDRIRDDITCQASAPSNTATRAETQILHEQLSGMINVQTKFDNAVPEMEQRVALLESLLTYSADTVKKGSALDTVRQRNLLHRRTMELMSCDKLQRLMDNTVTAAEAIPWLKDNVERHGFGPTGIRSSLLNISQC